MGVFSLCTINFFCLPSLLGRFDFSIAFANVANFDRNSISIVDFLSTSRSGRRTLPRISSQLCGKNNDEETNYALEEVISHPVLQQVYPLLREHKTNFGHPNIPLGSKAGRMCSTIRRLYFRNKLTEEEVSLLENLGFSFLCFDNIYFEANFDAMLQRLLQYEEEHKNNYQVPKKYPFDVQLGAWVTNLRRLGPNSIDISPEHKKVLNQIHFSWTSKRRCGSSFMTNLRQVRSALDNCSGVSGDVVDVNQCLSHDLRTWLVAQREARAKGNLNEMRVNYIEELCQDFRIDISNVEK